ncbi:cutinase [Leptodontidium sp. MPI-SDFR-AT-0119]|nr:cutinase [Leptodontidium sp. MPI-SDFR-AT-0119]
MRTCTLFSYATPLAGTALGLKAPLRARADNATTSSNTTCATGVHMIVARASVEKPGQGTIGGVVTLVQQAVPGSDSEAVDYPATLTDYLNSEAAGVAAMQILIQDYATRCPNSKIALLGYSQGAQVVGDVMCGTSETAFNMTSPLDIGLAKNIVAVIQMGDPSFTVGQPQNVGNATKGGIFKRQDLAACALSASITKSYCDATDKYCDSGNSSAVHAAYVKEYGTEAATFIESKVNGSATVITSSAGDGTRGLLVKVLLNSAFVFCVYQMI